MTAVKSFVTNAVTVNAEVSRDVNDRKKMKSLKVLKEKERDQESNSSSSEEVEYYSPKSVNPNARNVKFKNVLGVRINNPVLRIRSEDRQIGEDIGEGYVTMFGDRKDGMFFSRPVSPLGKMSLFGTEE